MAGFRSRVPSSLLLGFVGILTSARGVVAHGGHNMEKISEGEAMSQEPLVRQIGVRRYAQGYIC
jgi:hypothetical protein